MTDYALVGKKGTGKSKNAVRLVRDRYLKRDRRVASNLDIYLSPMFGPHSRYTYVRVPDKPPPLICWRPAMATPAATKRTTMAV